MKPNPTPVGIEGFARALGISDGQLKGMRFEFRKKFDTEELAEESLLAWMKKSHEQSRDRTRMLAKGSGYTEYAAGSMGSSDRSMKGNLREEMEAIDPDLVQATAKSREARDRWQAEKMEDLQPLLTAMGSLRAAMEESKEKTLGSSRSLRILRSRLDSAEQQIRSQLAA